VSAGWRQIESCLSKLAGNPADLEPDSACFDVPTLRAAWNFMERFRRDENRVKFKTSRLVKFPFLKSFFSYSTGLEFAFCSSEFDI
jgi:hypothetical protein